MTPDQAQAILKSDPAVDPSPTTEATCSWCGKKSSEAKKMLSNRNAHICDGCVSLCSDILTSELGEGWR